MEGRTDKNKVIFGFPTKFTVDTDTKRLSYATLCIIKVHKYEKRDKNDLAPFSGFLPSLRYTIVRTLRVTSFEIEDGDNKTMSKDAENDDNERILSFLECHRLCFNIRVV